MDNLSPNQQDLLLQAQVSELSARAYFFRSVADVLQTFNRLCKGGDLELLLRSLKRELD